MAEGRTIKASFGKNLHSDNLKQWLRSMFIAVALVIVVLLCYFAFSILISGIDIWMKVLFIIGLTLLLGSAIWALTFISPKVFEMISQSIKADEKEEKKSIQFRNDPSKADYSGRTQKFSNGNARIDEESESEKLRREFRNRKL